MHTSTYMHTYVNMHAKSRKFFDFIHFLQIQALAHYKPPIRKQRAPAVYDFNRRYPSASSSLVFAPPFSPVVSALSPTLTLSLGARKAARGSVMVGTGDWQLGCTAFDRRLLTDTSCVLTDTSCVLCVETPARLSTPRHELSVAKGCRDTLLPRIVLVRRSNPFRRPDPTSPPSPCHSHSHPPPWSLSTSRFFVCRLSSDTEELSKLH
jgi:hypothetical protein